MVQDEKSSTEGMPSVIVGAPIARKKNKAPIVLGILIAIIAAALLIACLTIPRCSGHPMTANKADMMTLVSGSDEEAQKALDRMSTVQIGEGLASVKLYTTSDKMMSFVGDVAMHVGEGGGYADLLNAEKAKEINGDWVVLSTADKGVQSLITLLTGSMSASGAGSSAKDYDLSHLVLAATVVSDDDLTNTEIARLVEGNILTPTHAQVGSFDKDTLFSFLQKGVKLTAAYSGYGSNANSSSYLTLYLAQLKSALDSAGATKLSQGAYYSKGEYAMSFAAQLDGYAVVVVLAFDPNDVGLGNLIGDDYLNSLYMK